VRRVWIRANPRKTAWTRLVFYGSFLATSTALGLLVRGPIDVVFATSPPLPVGLAGWAIARARGARFVLDVRDLWPAAALALGMLRDGAALRLAEGLERFLYRRADRITAVTRGFVRHITPLAGGPDRVVWVPNGAAEVFDPTLADPTVAVRLGLEGRFVVTFAGLHGMAQGLGAVLEAADRLRCRPDVVFCLIGDGPVKDALVRRAAELDLVNVRFLPVVPHAEITPYLTAAHALLVPLRRHPVFDTFVPSKLYDFLACGRPVILMANGEAREILEASGGGLHSLPEDGKCLADTILRLIAMSEGERQRMGDRGRAFARAHFTRAAHAARLVELLETLAR